MARPRTEINPIRAERVKIILEREKLTQKEFSDAIHRSQQNISNIIRLKEGLTEDNAKEIVKQFPKYRIEWLLGLDDYMTEYDWADNVQLKKDIAAECVWGIIEKSLNKNGKSLKFVHHSGQHLNSSERLQADCYYSIEDHEGNELKRLTALEMVKFEEKLQEYCDFLTNKYL